MSMVGRFWGFIAIVKKSLNRLPITIVIASVAFLIRVSYGSGKENGTESAEQFLNSVLSADFSGDGEARVGKVIFTDGQPEIMDRENQDSGPWSRAEYNLYEDPVVIVSDWKIIGSHSQTSGRTVVDVLFHTLATMWRGEGGRGWQRQVLPLPQAIDQVIHYNLVYKKSDWKIIDPPMPRVSAPPLISIFKGNLHQEQEFLAMSKGDRKEDKNTKNIYMQSINYYNRQLILMENLPSNK